MRPNVVVVALVAVLACACGSLENSASKDPMKCERNPKCSQMNARDRDCSTQCVDDPACMDRCRQVQTDGIGH